MASFIFDIYITDISDGDLMKRKNILRCFTLIGGYFNFQRSMRSGGSQTRISATRHLIRPNLLPLAFSQQAKLSSNSTFLTFIALYFLKTWWAFWTKTRVGTFIFHQNEGDYVLPFFILSISHQVFTFPWKMNNATIHIKSF